MNALSLSCGCTRDSLCAVAKRLWKLKGSKGRRDYSDHRVIALGEENVGLRRTRWDGGRFIDGISYWANNLKT